MSFLYLFCELFVNAGGDVLDSKFIERPKKFDKKEYDKNFHKENYVHFGSAVKPELKNRIDNYCADMGISKSEFLKRAIEMLESQ